MVCNHKPIPKLTGEEIERFWSKVTKAGVDDCWNWHAGKYDSGYGQFKIRQISYRSPRIVYYLSRGRDPGPLNVLHTCDNRACCNPNHLWHGTLDDNNKDRARKHRSAINKNPNPGETNGRVKLTTGDVLEIRRSKKSNAEMAVKKGVSNQLVSRIRLGELWKHLL